LFSSSVISVSIIAVHRYVKICHYKLCLRIFTKTSVSVIIAAVWVTGAIFALPLLWMEKSLILDPTLQMCTYNRYVSQTYSIVFLCVCVFTPVGITVICYCKIYIYVQRHKKRLLTWNNGIGQTRFRSDLSATKSAFVVFLYYLVSCSLFGVIATFFNNPSEVSVEIHAISIYVCYGNSCVNTLIYGVMNKDVLKAYKEATFCCRSRRIQDIQSDR
jgi:hypothetical protein